MALYDLYLIYETAGARRYSQGGLNEVKVCAGSSGPPWPQWFAGCGGQVVGLKQFIGRKDQGYRLIWSDLVDIAQHPTSDPHFIAKAGSNWELVKQTGPHADYSPYGDPAYRDIPDYRRYPQLDPFSIPINTPMPTPKALPVWTLPFRHPSYDRVEQSENGPDIEWQRRLRPYPNRAFQPRPLRPGVSRPSGQANPDLWPLGEPGVLTVSPGRPSTLSPPVGRRPPGKGEKQKKVRPRYALLQGGISLVTEGLDVIDALYDALPEQLRRRKRRAGQASLPERIETLYDNFLDIDPEKAFTNLVVDQIEDAILGRIGQKLGKSAKREGRGGSVLVGPAL